MASKSRPMRGMVSGGIWSRRRATLSSSIKYFINSPRSVTRSFLERVESVSMCLPICSIDPIIPFSLKKDLLTACSARYRVHGRFLLRSRFCTPAKRPPAVAAMCRSAGVCPESWIPIRYETPQGIGAVGVHREGQTLPTGVVSGL